MHGPSRGNVQDGTQHGIGFEDLPPFKLNVLPARLADDEAGSREAPDWGLLASLGYVAVVALALRRQ